MCSMLGLEVKFLSDPAKFDVAKCPFFEVDLPDYKAARDIVSRSVMIKYILDPISQGNSYQELVENMDKERFETMLNSKRTVKFKVEAIEKKIKPKERDEIINMYEVFAKEDVVFKMIDPDDTYMVVSNPKTDEFYFGLEVACISWKTSKSNFYAKYDLKVRPYLGPTSTSHELAFLMANQAEIKEGDFVYDPFAGTGSILIACSALKGICFGSDIDLRVLQGYSVGKKANKEIPGTEIIKRYDIFANFKYYGLPKPSIIAMDIAYPTMLLRKFDAIVCDPPYGVKAGSKMTKAGNKASSQESKWNIANEGTIGIFTKKQSYGVNKIYDTLLRIASKLLKKGGRLVFLFHTDVSYPPEYNEFPKHPCFELVHS